MTAFVKAAKVLDEELQSPSDESDSSDEVEQLLMREFNIKWNLISLFMQYLLNPAWGMLKSEYFSHVRSLWPTHFTPE